MTRLRSARDVPPDLAQDGLCRAFARPLLARWAHGVSSPGFAAPARPLFLPRGRCARSPQVGVAHSAKYSAMLRSFSSDLP